LKKVEDNRKTYLKEQDEKWKNDQVHVKRSSSNAFRTSTSKKNSDAFAPNSNIQLKRINDYNINTNSNYGLEDDKIKLINQIKESISNKNCVSNYILSGIEEIKNQIGSLKVLKKKNEHLITQLDKDLAEVFQRKLLNAYEKSALSLKKRKSRSRSTNKQKLPKNFSCFLVILLNNI
jgi:hypothetical protein